MLLVLFAKHRYSFLECFCQTLYILQNDLSPGHSWLITLAFICHSCPPRPLDVHDVCVLLWCSHSPVSLMSFKSVLRDYTYFLLIIWGNYRETIHVFQEHNTAFSTGREVERMLVKH